METPSQVLSFRSSYTPESQILRARRSANSPPSTAPLPPRPRPLLPPSTAPSASPYNGPREAASRRRGGSRPTYSSVDDTQHRRPYPSYQTATQGNAMKMPVHSCRLSRSRSCSSLPPFSALERRSPARSGHSMRRSCPGGVALHPTNTPVSIASWQDPFHPSELVLPNSPSPYPFSECKGARAAWLQPSLIAPFRQENALFSPRPLLVTPSGSSGHTSPNLRLSSQRSSKASPAQMCPTGASLRRGKHVSLPGCAPPPNREPLHAWLPEPTLSTAGLARSTSDPRDPSLSQPSAHIPAFHNTSCSKRSAKSADPLSSSLSVTSRQHAAFDLPTSVGMGEQRQLLAALGLPADIQPRNIPSMAQRTPAMFDIPPVEREVGVDPPTCPSLLKQLSKDMAQRTDAMHDMPAIDLSSVIALDASPALPTELQAILAQRTPAISNMSAFPGIGTSLGDNLSCTLAAGSASAEPSLVSNKSHSRDVQVCTRTEAVANLAELEAGRTAGASNSRRHCPQTHRPSWSQIRDILPAFPSLDASHASFSHASDLSAEQALAATATDVAMAEVVGSSLRPSPAYKQDLVLSELDSLNNEMASKSLPETSLRGSAGDQTSRSCLSGVIGALLCSTAVQQQATTAQTA